MVNPRTVAIARRNVGKTLTQSCLIERETTTKGTMGEPLHSWEVVARSVPCRVIRAGASNTSAYENVGSQESLVERFRLIFPVGTAFMVDDRVTVDGQVYHVVNVVDALTDEAFSSAWIAGVRNADQS